MTTLRVAVRVRPGASRTRVGGALGDRLVVAVNAHAVDGQATESALVALAKAFGVKRRQVFLITGAISRDKVVEIEGDMEQLQTTLLQLRLK